MDTKSETTAKAIEAIIQLIREMREKEVTDEELKTAKESILNGFVFNFQNVGQIVSRLMAYEYYHYPPDFLEKYKANVEKVTKADVLRVAQRQLQPDQLAVLAVGRDKDFDKPLDKLAYAGGRVNTIDITIPDKKPGTAVAAGAPASPAALERGKAILASAGMRFTDVVKLTAYLIHEDSLDGFRKARGAHLGEHRPASTLVIARRLAQPGWLVEIEAIAAKA